MNANPSPTTYNQQEEACFTTPPQAHPSSSQSQAIPSSRFMRYHSAQIRYPLTSPYSTIRSKKSAQSL